MPYFAVQCYCGKAVFRLNPSFPIQHELDGFIRNQVNRLISDAIYSAFSSVSLSVDSNGLM